MPPYKEFHLDKRNGITAIIMNRGRVLIMKRTYIPFKISPGIWTFVCGGRKRGERYIETAYREIREEAGIPKKRLRLLSKYDRVMKIDVGMRRKFYDHLYLFYSETREVRRNIENTKHRWARLNEIRNEREYTNVFADKHLIERMIERAIDEE
ncbi:MAG: NUDIX hydrolase [Candidatus Micrarchaeales archaeon]